MNIRLVPKSLFAALIATMLLTASSVMAQVKIGTNPTTIGATNNLEVEGATSGRKTAIDKTTGQVTIKDGTEGANKVFTSDANGGGSWQAIAIQSAPAMLSVFKSTNTNQALGAGGTFTKVDFGGKFFDKNTNFDLATDSFTVPANASGYYQLSGRYACTPVVQTTGVAIYMYVNGAIVRAVCAGEINGNGSITAQLNAGDVVTFYFQTSFANATIASAGMDIFMISR